ncbi:MAG TPA: serine/threonine-protein kinase [Kofleriaceae bacterium]|nr:serine/threonine-protein kinase [Kofleriaceae bacterium]
MTASVPPTVSAISAIGAAPARSLELPRGTAVGRYIVLEPIGQGGMGVVYKAYDPDLARNVALKLVRADPRNPDHRQRLRARLWREAQALARLAHPNVIAVHDVGTHEDSVFVAMELVDGTTLTRVLADEAPPLPRIVELFIAAARGLAAAHAVSIIHRDFKPDNVIVGRDGRVRVLDFGLARAVRGELDDASELAAGSAGSPSSPGSPGSGDRHATESQLAVGTPAYMAPEQRDGSDLDERADQFSFCVAVYEAVFGRRPDPELIAVPGRTPAGVRVPGRLRAALLRGLAHDPAARHRSMHALIGELAAHSGRRRIAAGAAAAGAIVIAALAIGATRAADPAAPCDGLAARLAGVWDAARRTAVGDALRRQGDPTAAATAVRLLDGYTSSWLAMHTASCRATHVLGEQSAELLDLRTQCLDRRLAEVRYLTDLLLDADRDTATRAVAGVHALAPLEDCANTVALRDPIAPRDPALARTLRDRLPRMRAQFHIGKYADVTRDAPPLAAAAAAAGDRWLEASATYLAAKASRQLGQIPHAEDELYRAIAIAEAGRASDVVVDAWMTLAWITAEDRDRYADALRLAGVAGGVLQRLGGEPRLEATLEDHVGVLHLDRNELVDARRHLERGLALREKLLGPASDDYARSLQHLAILEEADGNLPRALELHHRARTIAEAELGPRHPDVLAMLSAEGAALYKLRRYTEAVDLLGRGLATAEQVTGPSSDLAASFLTNLGLAQQELKHHAEARAAFERSYAIHAQHGSDSLGAGTLDINLALLLLETGEIGPARSHAEHAVAIFDKVLGPTHPDLAMALEALATAELRSKRPERAVPALERAVAIRAASAATAPNDLAATRFDLAKAIIAAHGSTARARQLAEDARHALEGIGDADGVREVSAWLQAHP